MITYEWKGQRIVARNLRRALEIAEKNMPVVQEFIGNKTVNATKRTIKTQDFHSWSAHHDKELSNETLKARKRGVYWKGARVPPTSGKRALIQTGNLLDSIKYVPDKDGVSMARYGIHHNNGFPNFNANMTVQREYITLHNKKKMKKIVKQQIQDPIKKIFGQM